MSKAKKIPKHISVNDRWEKGIDHDPRSTEILNFMDKLDWEECDGSADLQFGGDGDNGEHLLFLMDVYFELKDKGKL